MLGGATYCELCQVSVQILSHGDQTDNKNSVRGCNRKSSNKQADFWGELNLKFMILIVLKLKGNTLGDSKVPIFIFCRVISLAVLHSSVMKNFLLPHVFRYRLKELLGCATLNKHRCIW